MTDSKTKGRDVIMSEIEKKKAAGLVNLGEAWGGGVLAEHAFDEEEE